jgi:hypothetical protein
MPCPTCSTDPIRVPGILLIENDVESRVYPGDATTVGRCAQCSIYASDEAARVALDTLDDELGGRSYVYSVKISAIITLSCAPTAPTFKQAILENVLAWLDVVISQDTTEEAFDAIVDEVRLEDLVRETQA